MKRFFNFLFNPSSHWFITFYVSAAGSVFLLALKGDNPYLTLLAIVFTIIFIAAIVFAVIEVVRGVKMLIKMTKTLINRILSPLDRYKIEITLKF